LILVIVRNSEILAASSTNNRKTFPKGLSFKLYFRI